MNAGNEWFRIKNEQDIDSPALLVYADRVAANIRTLIDSIDDVSRLRPHIKTNKSPQVCTMMINAGIRKFKCATISEAEMLAAVGARDILLAYQPIGPKAKRLLELIQDYKECRFSCLVDNLPAAMELADLFRHGQETLNVHIDLNVGMNRTGIVPAEAMELARQLLNLKGVRLVGLHAYDGHLRDENYDERKQKCDQAFSAVLQLQQQFEREHEQKLVIVAGGTPSYSIHSKRKEVECSPGTFIYWDIGYGQRLPEQQYQYAALVFGRVVSKPALGKICVDIGHKAIASENPLENRIRFLNLPKIKPVSHSEEHLVLETDEDVPLGTVLYGVPYHVCPTVALYDHAQVVKDGEAIEVWENISRSRKLTI